MTTARILEAAADKIERDGWCQCGGLPLNGQPTCAGNAITAVQGGGTRWTKDDATFAIAVCGKDSATGLYAWNDAPGRTKEEVIAMLRAVAATERARESLRDASPEAPTQNTAVPLEPPVAVSA